MDDRLRSTQWRAYLVGAVALPLIVSALAERSADAIEARKTPALDWQWDKTAAPTRVSS